MEQRFRIKVDDHHSFELSETGIRQWDVTETSDGKLHFILDGQSFTANLVYGDTYEKQYSVEVNGQRFDIRMQDELDQLIHKLGMKSASRKDSNHILAPMPGLVVKILVSPGDILEAGQPVLILEAMKMENVLKAGGAGRVQEIRIEPGNTVEKNQLLVSIEPVPAGS